jgi:hypothetical protein
MHQHVLRFGRRVAIAVAGGTVLVAGILLALPLVPGPGIPLMLVGLGILSLEFKQPRLWLARARAWGVQLKHRFDQRRTR